MNEVWRSISGHPDYEVSDLGRVRRKVGHRCRLGRILSLRKDGRGYLIAHLCTAGVRKNGPVHQLVCAAFHGPRPSNLHQVAHGDGVRTNNSATNLRWATAMENAADRSRHGRTVGRPPLKRGCDNGKSALTAEQVLAIRLHAGTTTQIAGEFGVSKATIWRVKAGKSYRPVEDLTNEARAA